MILNRSPRVATMIISLFEMPLIIVSATRMLWSRWSSDGLASVYDPSNSANIPTNLGYTNHPWISPWKSVRVLSLQMCSRLVDYQLWPDHAFETSLVHAVL